MIAAAPVREPLAAEPVEPGLAPLGWEAPLCDFALAIAASWRQILAALVLATLAAAAYLLLAPPFYRASSVAVLLPREKPILDATINSSAVEVSDDQAKRTSTGSLMLPAKPELYLALLRSRAVLRQLADRFGPRLGLPVNGTRSDEEIEALNRAIRIETSEEGLLTITVTADAPELAAELANALLDEGKRASAEIERQMLLQQANHLREILDQRRASLAAAERELELFSSKHSLVDLGIQTTQDLVLLKETRAKRDRLRAELCALSERFTPEDYRMKEAHTRLRSAERDLARIESAMVGGAGVDQVGSLSVQLKSLQERVRLDRDVVATLSLRADLFRLRAEQPAGSLAVIRPAVPVLRKAGPAKKRTLLLALGAALVLSLGYAVLAAQWRKARETDYVRGQLEQLRATLRGA